MVFSTLRGFRFRGASPIKNNVIVGGELQLLGTAEYMFPITADDTLRGVLFCDFGTVEEKPEIDMKNFRVAPGFGMRINIAAMGPAPIALDFAFRSRMPKGINNKSLRSSWVLHAKDSCG